MKKILFISVILLGFFSKGYANERMLWYKLDQPPYYMPDESGIHDKIIDYFVEKLHEYEHEFQRSSLKRTFVEIQKKKPVVLVGIYKTQERQKYTLYPAVPLYLNFNTVLVVRKKDLEKIEPYLLEDNAIDLEKLILSKKFVIGITKGRMFTGIIDEMINKYKGTEAFHLRSSTAVTTGHLKMLVKNRIDAYFDQPVSLGPSAKIVGIDADEIAAVPISGRKLYEPVWLGLPYSQWGNNVNRRIHEIMNEKETIETFSGYYEEHIGNSLKALYRKAYRKHYLESYGIDLSKNIKLNQ